MSLKKSKAMFDRVVTQIGVLPLEALLPALLGEIAELLKVERVGYSRMEDDGRAIQQDIQYLRSLKSCDGKVVRLLAKDYPGYFAALQVPSSLIISHDVMADARLVEFRESYFKPIGITSMLDVPVHRSGKLFGVICHEHVGPKRRWTDKEVELARSLGHLVALAVETQERQEMEAELSRALEAEKELVQLKTSFVNLVSHEFRTPLSVIVSAADILEHYHDRLQPGQRAGHLQDIRHATSQMTRLMEEVLLLGKVEAGKMTFKPEIMDLEGFCRRLVDEQLSATNRKCPVTLELGKFPGAHGDEGLLRHIFTNLLSNAIKYSPAGSPVRFTVVREADEAVVVLRDRGIGIPLEDQPRLFEVFHRARNVGEIPGTGLGLVIVKRCIDLHGGHIQVESEPRFGTIFTIRLKMFPAVRKVKSKITPKKSR